MKTFKTYITESLNTTQYILFNKLDPVLKKNDPNLFNTFLTKLIELHGHEFRRLVYGVEANEISLKRVQQILKRIWRKLKEKQGYIS